MEYYMVSENNDWEGETWRWYIPANEKNLEDLTALKDTLEEFEEYRIFLTPIKEVIVKDRIENQRVGYMFPHNWGPKSVPELPEGLDEEGIERLFYKGKFWRNG